MHKITQHGKTVEGFEKIAFGKMVNGAFIGGILTAPNTPDNPHAIQKFEHLTLEEMAQEMGGN